MYRLSLFITLFVLSTGCDRTAAREQSNPVTPAQDQVADRSNHGAGEDVQIQTIPVAGNIYMLVGQGGNIGVSVGEDGILIIDDQFAPLADKIRSALAALHKGELEYVLNTHHHGDHVGGNPIFGEKATIIAHENVRKHLVTQGFAKTGLPVITFDQSLTVHFNGETIRAVHYANGHTDGDSIIFFESSNVVHMGDEFFNGRFPFVDMAHGGDPMKLMANVEAVMGMLRPDARIIPGHGPLGTLDDLRAYHQMLVETSALVREQVKAGKSLDEIKKKGLPARWNAWSSKFVSTERWIEILYQGLRK